VHSYFYKKSPRRSKGKSGEGAPLNLQKRGLEEYFPFLRAHVVVKPGGGGGSDRASRAISRLCKTCTFFSKLKAIRRDQPCLQKVLLLLSREKVKTGSQGSMHSSLQD